MIFRQIIVMIIFIIICLGAGFLGSVSTIPNIQGWYAGINKPPWNPPDGVFGPVWTFLYITMGVAAWLVWKKTGTMASTAMYSFVLQLILNIAWSYLFFGLHNPLAGLIDISLMWIAILTTIIFFWNVSPVAGMILIPYILWVSFAAVLNFTIWRMN